MSRKIDKILKIDCKDFGKDKSALTRSVIMLPRQITSINSTKFMIWTWLQNKLNYKTKTLEF